MKNKGATLIPILVIIALAIVAAAGAYYATQNNVKTTTTNETSDINTTVPTTTLLLNTNANQTLTSNWVSYTNVEFSMTLKHPTTWTIDTAQTTADTIIFTTGIEGDLVAITMTSGQTLDEWSQQFDSAIIVKRASFNLGTHPGMYVQASTEGFLHAAIIKGDKLYEFTASSDLEAVLSTVTFMGVSTALTNENTNSSANQ